jgi:hypothetical protein
MRKWIVLLIVVFALGTVMGQSSTPPGQKKQFLKETVSSAASSQQDLKNLSPERQKKVLAAQEKAAAQEAKINEEKKQDPNWQAWANFSSAQQTLSKAKVVAGPIAASPAVGKKSLADNVLFFEDFEGSSTAEPNPLTNGLTNVGTPGGNAWSTQLLYNGAVPQVGHSGTRYADILYHASVAHNAWAYTPAINLTSGKNYKISFWVKIIGWQGTFERLEVKIGTGTTPATQTQVIYDNGQTDVTNWSEITYSYTPTQTGAYYIGFHSFSPADVNATYFDDVKVEEINSSIPAVPTNFTVTPDVGGALSALLSWTNPSKTIGGANLASLTSLVIQRGGTTIHTINNPTPGSAGTWTDTTPVNGNNTYSIYATNSDGSSDVVSQTVFVGIDPCSVGVTTFPYSQGFEDNATLECWWTYNIDLGGTSWGVSPSQKHSGTYSAAHTYSAAGNQDGYLVSSKIVIPAGTALELSFWSYNTYPTYYGKNSVLISQGSGDPRDNAFQEVWSPTAVTSSWVQTKINLGAYTGKTIYIAFRYQGNDAHDWYLDDISLTELFGVDAGVSAIVTPVTGTNLTATEAIKVKVKNFGAASISNIPVKVSVDGGSPITETVPGPIIAGGEIEYSFTGTANLSVVKSYTITAYTQLTDDANLHNDTISATVVNLGDCSVSAFPYSEGVESNTTLSCWNIGDIDGLGTKWEVSTARAHSGTRSYAHTYAASTAGNQDGWLVTPKFVLPDDGGYELSFWSYNNYPGDYEKNSVLISTGSGTPGSADFVEIWSPTSVLASWVQTKINLSQYAGESIYLAFRYQGTFAHDWFIDDFAFIELPPYDAGVTAIVSPASGSNLTSAETITVKVRNFGTKPLSNVCVTFDASNGASATEVIPGPIAPNTEITYTFTTKINLSAPGTYTFSAYTNIGLTDDGNPSNDKLTTQVINYGDISVMGTGTSTTSCSTTFVDDGIYSSYIPSENQIQTKTFYPGTSGSRIKADFTRFAVYPYEIFFIWEFPGDTLFVYDGSVVNESKRLAALTDDLNNNLPGSYVSSSPDGALTFVFKKLSGAALEGWEANISCIVPSPYDAGVTKILSPTVGGSATTQVKVEIKNFGSSTLTSVPVAYKFQGGSVVTETFTGSIAPGATAQYTFTKTADITVSGTYTFEAYTSLPNDGNASNDKTSGSFIHGLYGYRVYPSTGLISFTATNPGSVSTLNTFADGSNSVITGEYVNGYVYIFTSDNSDLSPRFLKVDASTSAWTVASKVNVSDYPYDVTYDYSTGTLFALTLDGGLATVNLTTGALNTIVPELSQYLVSFAADLSGQLYGVGFDGNLYKLNKTTGALTLVGQTGYSPNYLQKMAFDHNTEKLFWAFINTGTDGALIELNPATGAAQNRGLIGTSSEIAILYTPYTYSTGPELVSINIADGATGVNPTLSIIATFSKNIASTSLAGIQLTKDGTTEKISLTPTISGSVLTIAHPSLASLTKYNLVIPAGTITGYDAEIALSFTTIQQVGIITADNKSSILVYPNPSQGTVYFSNLPANSSIRILDLTGRTVDTYSKVIDNKLDLNLSSGVYFIQIENDKAKEIHKLIIK